MSSGAENSWKTLIISKGDIQLKPTLSGGQSFRWKNLENNYWIGIFKNLVWKLSQSDDCISYQCLGHPLYENVTGNRERKNLGFNVNLADDPENILKSYFRLDVDLNHYYKIWSDSDQYFRKATTSLHGIRVLHQEVTENIFSFICSSNNNIKRISSMVEKLCKFYGDPIAEVDGQLYFSFPEVHKLAESTVESTLRKEGFGYRAKFIYQTACMIEKLGGCLWLENLKFLPYEEAKKELMKLSGIGAKVADCICLMSLGHMEAVPVDTHIFQVASNVYLPHLKRYKSLNNKVYNEIADHFRFLHGNYAGWANTILFCSSLKIN